MWNKTFILRCGRVAALVGLLTSFGQKLNAQAQRNSVPVTNATIVLIEGRVEIQHAGLPASVMARTNDVLAVGDRVRVQQKSRLTIKLPNQSIMRFNEGSDFQIDAPQAPAGRSRFQLLQGILYFFHRGAPTDLELRSRSVSAAVLGTEFNMAVVDGGVVLTVLDGEVELSNPLGGVKLNNQDQGVAEPGNVPIARKLSSMDAINTIQWTLYYPGVLDLDEIALEEPARQALRLSLDAYRSGNLLLAVAEYPAGRLPQSDSEKIYLAALLLAVGQVDDAEPLLNSLPRAAAGPFPVNQRLADALRQLISAVKLQPAVMAQNPELATEFLAESYYQQSLARLPEALKAARAAVAKSSQFGFGWERVAELEFSFGRIDAASEALGKALLLSSGNAQAVALKGFLLAAQNKIQPAIRQFNQAIALDGALANGWLGRGLCLIRSGKSAAGREDLLVAAALEPQRAFLRSYLGKAYSDAGDKIRAEHEIDRAKNLDPRDPTAWLYSALLKQQNSQINDAIHDLEHSQDLSTNRAVYRSQFKLDEDRAVRSANLAHIYRDAGMDDWSVREAGRAVSDDYANYSAHLFLANSYDQLRDPNRINLRYETPAESEYLIANLLAPVGAGTLSQTISQQEYSKLFERDRLGVVSSTEYLSRGAWYENGAQFGTFGNSSYAIEAVYRSDPGQRPNNDLQERELRLHFKQQLTPQDSIYLRAINYESEGGDRFQYYDPTNSNPGLRVKERQEPTLTLGYHHEWTPGSHLLFAGGWFEDTYDVIDPRSYLLKKAEFAGTLGSVAPMNADLSIRTKLEIYSVEAQQIWESPRHTIIIGGRFQSGDFNIEPGHFRPLGEVITLFQQPPALKSLNPHFERWSAYGYFSWRPVDSLLLAGGVSYDRLRFPENLRSVPMSDSEETVERVLPKAGLIWTPKGSTTIRAAYTRSLAGVSLDQSIRLEPTEVAGFNQAFRSIVPESVAGANAAARFETYDVSLEQRLGRGTYLSAGGQLLYSEIPRTIGAFALDIDVSDYVFPSGMKEQINYRERSVFFSVDQLIGKEWAVGARYRLADARFNDEFPEITPTTILIKPFNGDQHNESVLHQIDLRAVYNEQHGFFTQFHALWNSQSNSGYTPDRPGDHFWQFDLLGGYRFARRKAQITLGILNLTGTNYRLNPLILYNELPRERTFVARFDFNF